jgi:hypothetical protein
MIKYAELVSPFDRTAREKDKGTHLVMMVGRFLLNNPEADAEHLRTWAASKGLDTDRALDAAVGMGARFAKRALEGKLKADIAPALDSLENKIDKHAGRIMAAFEDELSKLAAIVPPRPMAKKHLSRRRTSLSSPRPVGEVQPPTNAAFDPLGHEVNQ